MMLRLTYEYEFGKSQGDTKSMIGEFFEMHNIIFVPIVNIDGFHEINAYWKRDNTLEFFRKNMRKEGGVSCQTSVDYGVDLNRNYDLAFGRDADGSSGGECADDYRGPHAFSEPETRQIKNLIEKTKEGASIKIAMNFHAWGNMYVHPWSFAKVPT
jgi:carboxypeptidase T